jgi:6-hydroxynicotinate reductase
VTTTHAGTDAPDPAALAAASLPADGIVTCDACPVLCRIRPGRSGACDRYANLDGRLARVDPLTVLARAPEAVRFAAADWDGDPIAARDVFVTALGAGTTYPDYKPAPFIVASEIDGIDMVTVVSEGIFSYCGLKLKIDTDRHLGAECAPVRADGEQVGHVTTMEYGSQMLSLGGVRHLTGGSKREGVVTCATMLTLANRGAVALSIDGGATITVQADAAPVIDGVPEHSMRVGCGSATIGIFAQQWLGHADEVIVVDDHITGVLTEHQAGRFLGMRPAGIRVRGRRSTPGRYFQVAAPGGGWGGTDIADPLAIVERIDPKMAWPGLRLLMVSTTGEHAAWFVLDDALRPVAATMPAAIAAIVARIRENCEPARCTVLFMAGAGGSLRAGTTENPVLLTRSVQRGEARVTTGGAPVYVWPGGGITIMVDVAAMPENSFGHVPTPALVAPIEFTLKLSDYAALGGHIGRVRRLEDVLRTERPRAARLPDGTAFPR